MLVKDSYDVLNNLLKSSYEDKIAQVLEEALNYSKDYVDQQVQKEKTRLENSLHTQIKLLNKNKNETIQQKKQQITQEISELKNAIFEEIFGLVKKEFLNLSKDDKEKIVLFLKLKLKEEIDSEGLKAKISYQKIRNYEDFRVWSETPKIFFELSLDEVLENNKKELMRKI